MTHRAYVDRLVALALALLAAVLAPIEHPWTFALLAPVVLASDLVMGAAFLVLLVVFLLLVLGIKNTEERLAARGETLFPARRRYDSNALRRNVDSALLAAVRALAAGGEPREVLGAVEAATHGGEALRGRAREFCDHAIDDLAAAAGTCRVLEWDERRRLVGRATRWLCLARVALRDDYHKEMRR